MAGKSAGRASGNIIVCGRAYNIGWKTVNYFTIRCSPPTTRAASGQEGGKPQSPFPFAPAKGLERAKRYRERRLMGSSRNDLRRLQRHPAAVRRPSRRLRHVGDLASTFCTMSAACRCTSSSTTMGRFIRRWTSSMARITRPA